MTRLAGRYWCAASFIYMGVVLNGCASTHDPSTLLAVESLTAKVTQRVCDVLETCCNEAQHAYEEQGCKAFYTKRIRGYFSSQTFLGAKLDGEAVKRCLASIGEVSEGCPVDRVSTYMTDECSRVFRGTVPLGGECDSDHGCATTPDSPLTCDIPYDAQANDWADSGVCIRPASLDAPHTLAGQACSGTCIDDDGPPCFGEIGICNASDGLFCSLETNQCEPRGVSGDPCNGSPDCSKGSYCNFEDGQCAAIRPLGSACTDADQCGQYYCAGGTCQLPPPSAEFCAGRVPPPPPPSTGPRQ